MGKSTISMVIFNSYVSSPEGNPSMLQFQIIHYLLGSCVCVHMCGRKRWSDPSIPSIPSIDSIYNSDLKSGHPSILIYPNLYLPPPKKRGSSTGLDACCATSVRFTSRFVRRCSAWDKGITKMVFSPDLGSEQWQENPQIMDFYNVVMVAHGFVCCFFI